MHPAKLFHMTNPSLVYHALRQQPFCTLVTVSNEKPVCGHAPVVICNDGSVQFHLATSNVLTEALKSSQHGLITAVAHSSYISPDWYELDNQVPTWNYVSIEIEGPVRELTPDETIVLLDELSDEQESVLAPKSPWTRAKMSEAAFSSMLRAITGFQLTPSRIEGTTKLNQNKPADVQSRVIKALRALNPNDTIANLMEDNLNSVANLRSSQTNGDG